MRAIIDIGTCSLVRGLAYSIGMAVLGLALAAIILGGVGALALASRAYAQVVEQPRGADHGHLSFWINKGKYKAKNGNPNTHCCGPGDCKVWPLKQTRVHPTGAIDLFNPDGSLWLTVPPEEVQASEDHDAWVCKRTNPGPDDKPYRCFFYPIGGV